MFARAPCDTSLRPVLACLLQVYWAQIITSYKDLLWWSVQDAWSNLNRFNLGFLSSMFRHGVIHSATAGQYRSGTRICTPCNHLDSTALVLLSCLWCRTGQWWQDLLTLLSPCLRKSNKPHATFPFEHMGLGQGWAVQTLRIYYKGSSRMTNISDLHSHQALPSWCWGLPVSPGHAE